MNRTRPTLLTVLVLSLVACGTSEHYDVLIENGTVYDGSGEPGVVADIAINGDRVAAIGNLGNASADLMVDATGMAVAPGFVNMLNFPGSLIIDGRSQSDLRQGVTLEVFGEGWFMAPMTDEMKAARRAELEDVFASVGLASLLGAEGVPWTSLGEQLEFLEARGVSTNFASFVSATGVRRHVLGSENRAPDAEEQARMIGLVRDAMEDGAVGLASSLIYAPAFYASTEELIALASEAGRHGGMYISHLRNEGNGILRAVDELITISREASIPAEIYHLKLAGSQNWDKLADVVERVERARADGHRVSANMYTYRAAGTGFDAAMPPWVQEGGGAAWRARLRDPEIRRRVVREMREVTDEWDNLMLGAGPDGTVLSDFLNPDLRHYIGRTLADVAAERGTSPEETVIDLVIEDESRVEALYFLMSEENLRRQVAIPWMSFGADNWSQPAEPPFTLLGSHPRDFGNTARLLGRYVREEAIIPLEEAIRKLTSLPTSNLGITDRGLLREGFMADVVVFDPDEIGDRGTFENPYQYSVGVVHVFVNGARVLANGEHTGALPGRVVRGPGWTGR